jgi:hypothetical protein
VRLPSAWARLLNAMPGSYRRSARGAALNPLATCAAHRLADAYVIFSAPARGAAPRDVSQTATMPEQPSPRQTQIPATSTPPPSTPRPAPADTRHAAPARPTPATPPPSTPPAPPSRTAPPSTPPAPPSRTAPARHPRGYPPPSAGAPHTSYPPPQHTAPAQLAAGRPHGLRSARVGRPAVAPVDRPPSAHAAPAPQRAPAQQWPPGTAQHPSRPAQSPVTHRPESPTNTDLARLDLQSLLQRPLR